MFINVWSWKDSNGRTQSLSPYISDFLNKHQISHAFIMSKYGYHFVLSFSCSECTHIT